MACRATLQACRGVDTALRGYGQRLLVLSGQPEVELPLLLENCIQHDSSGNAAAHSGSVPVTAEARAAAGRAHISTVCLYHMQQPLPEHAAEEAAVAKCFKERGDLLDVAARVKSFWGWTLYHPDDLPWDKFGASKARRPKGDLPCNAQSGAFVSLPDVMTHFRKPTQGHAQVSSPGEREQHSALLNSGMQPSVSLLLHVAAINQTDTK